MQEDLDEKETLKENESFLTATLYNAIRTNIEQNITP